MPNHTVSANARRLPSRRTILLTGAAASAALAAPVAAALAAPAPTAADCRAITLWARRARLKAIYAEAHRRYGEAAAALPWWAKAGSAYRSVDGEAPEDISGYPAMTGGCLRHGLIRPAPEDLLEIFRDERRTMDPEEARARYNANCEALIERQKAAARERERVGINDFSATTSRVIACVDEIHDEVVELDCAGSPHAAAVAALILILETLTNEENGDGIVCFNLSAAKYLLTLLRPSIGGVIAEDVDRLLACDENDDALEALTPYPERGEAKGEARREFLRGERA